LATENLALFIGLSEIHIAKYRDRTRPLYLVAGAWGCTVQSIVCSLPHALVRNAVNPGGLGAGPH